MSRLPHSDIPTDFAHTIRTVFAPHGEAWLANLPDLIAQCEARWHLRVGAPFALSYNYAAPATDKDGTHYVLKLGVPNREFKMEIDALKIYAGRGICRVIDSDAHNGILLLERLMPGVMLTTLLPDQDERATRIAADVMQRLWRPLGPASTMRSLESWTAELLDLRPAFGGGSGPFPAHLVARAESLRTELLASSGETVLLHGDLHHGNILQHADNWSAIDPKGVAGERAYEIASFLYNPMPSEITPRMLSRRIDIFVAMLGLDRARVCAWGLVQAILSAWWSYGGERQLDARMLAFAELIAAQ